MMRLITIIACAAVSCLGLVACPSPVSIPEPSDLVLFPPYALGFGEVQIGESVVLPWTIINTGNNQISITAITSNNSAFVPTTTSLTLAPGGSQDININFTPTNLGAALGFLTLQTDDASQFRRVALGGAGTNEVITIEARPFAILPGTNFTSPPGPFIPDLMLPLGVFVKGVDPGNTPVLNDPQGIGVYLKNTSTTPLMNVTASLMIPANSGIVADKDFESFGDLKPGVPVLGFFSANFAGSRPGLFDITLNITADGGFTSQTSRKIFVMTVVIDPTDLFQGVSDTLTAITPGGTLSRVITSYLDSPPRLTARVPVSFVDNLIPSSPYAGQISPPPFPDDTPWKGAGAGVALGAVIVGAWGEITNDADLKKTAVGIGTVAAIWVFADGEDPFRRGQLNTIPLPSETTVRETVEANVSYLQPPVIGESSKAEVSWNYTRFLDTGRELTYSVTEIVRNDRIVTDRTVAVNQDTLGVGDDLIITAQFRHRGGNLLSGMDAYVFAGVSTSVGRFVDKTVFLRDDGQQGDAVALDGLYTGTLPIRANDNPGTWNIFVFAQDINIAPQSSDITVLPYFIGGVPLSFPSNDGVNILPDKVITIH